MPCYHPLKGYRSRTVNPSGKRSLTFSPQDGFLDLPVEVQCGQCIGCRLERSRQWAVRCMHEASLHGDNAFITLTYADEHLPIAGSLDKKAFPKFMKRLRRKIGEEKVRYFHCGEYGDTTQRPHYHACLFGYDFTDKRRWSVRNGLPVWRSDTLEDLWKFGNSEIGTVTFESAAYVARYIMKKVTGRPAEEHYRIVDEATGEVFDRIPEYTTMSRRPGIGKKWFDKYHDEVYPSDQVIVRGRAMKPPRYYDGLYEILNERGAARITAARQAARDTEEETPERLQVREVCAQARLDTFSKREVRS